MVGRIFQKIIQFSSVQFSHSVVSDSLQPHENTKRQKDMTLKDELPRSVGAQYATGKEWRNNSRKNEEKEPKRCGQYW